MTGKKSYIPRIDPDYPSQIGFVGVAPEDLTPAEACYVEAMKGRDALSPTAQRHLDAVELAKLEVSRATGNAEALIDKIITRTREWHQNKLDTLTQLSSVPLDKPLTLDFDGEDPIVFEGGEVKGFVTGIMIAAVLFDKLPWSAEPTEGNSKEAVQD